MNTVTNDNFNDTMDGYVNYMIDLIIPCLREENFKEKQINDLVSLIKSGIRCGKDEMTMNSARKYIRKY